MPLLWNIWNLAQSKHTHNIRVKILGYLGPGGLHDDAKYPGHCIGGATGYIDRKVLSINHIYSNPTAKAVYDTDSFDPEGILGKK